MDQKDIEFLDNLVRNYFGKCDTNTLVFGNKDSYVVENVKFHTQDKKWLRGYVFNRVYKDFSPQSQAVENMHYYVKTDYFTKQIENYTNYVIDAYTKKVLKGLNKETLLSIEPARRPGVVSELVVSFLQKNVNIPRDVSMLRLVKRQEEFISQVNKILKNKNIEK